MGKNDPKLLWIKQQHEKNTLKTNQCDNAKDYMLKIGYAVPLKKLYKVVASCLYEEGANFCPVLIRIMNEDIKENIGGGIEFLL